MRDYIQRHGSREAHADLLMECKDIKSIEEMTDFDLLTAAGGALMGAKEHFVRPGKAEQPKVNIKDYFEPRSYKNIR